MLINQIGGKELWLFQNYIYIYIYIYIYFISLKMKFEVRPKTDKTASILN